MFLCVPTTRAASVVVDYLGQCEFERVVGDTSVFAWVVHPSAVPALSTERLHPLDPVPRSSPYRTPGSLKLSCRTNVPTAPATSNRPSLSPCGSALVDGLAVDY